MEDIGSYMELHRQHGSEPCKSRVLTEETVLIAKCLSPLAGLILKPPKFY